MKKRLAAIFGTVLLLFSFSGCSFSIMDTEALMQPPSPTGDKQMIQQLIREEAGAELKLCYPKNGSYRSAILMDEDLTGDGRPDVIGFYRTPDESGGTTIIFLTEENNGEWSVVAKYAYSYSQIDRVCFGDLNNDGKLEAVVGWGSPVNQTGNVSVYVWHENKMCDIRLGRTYSELVVEDLDGDGGDELFLTEVSKTESIDEETTKETPAKASLYRVKDDGIRNIATVDVDASVTRYAQVTVGQVAKGQLAVVMDGVKADNSMISELVYWQKTDGIGRLVVQPKNKDANSVNVSQRSDAAAITSRDINKDGYLEIPTVELMPGIEDDKGNISNYIVHWNRFDPEEGTLLRAASTVVSLDYGYCFVLPESWDGAVTCDVRESSISFFEWDTTATARTRKGELLLKIRVFTEEEWTRFSGVDQYNPLEKQNGYLYTVKLPETENPLRINLTEVENSFSLLS